MITHKKIIDYINLRCKFDNYIPKIISENRDFSSHTSLKDLIDNPSNNSDDILMTIKNLTEKDIEPFTLKKFLQEYLNKNPDVYSKAIISTEFRRAVSILDWLTYGVDFHKKKSATPKQ